MEADAEAAWAGSEDPAYVVIPPKGGSHAAAGVPPEGGSHDAADVPPEGGSHAAADVPP